MKRIILSLSILTAVAIAELGLSQPVEGVISYETKMNMHRRLPPNQEEMKKMIPQFRTTKEELYFNASESFYKPIIEDDAEDLSGEGVRIQLSAPYFEHYLDLSSRQMISKQEFMGKNYLITDSLRVAPWKFEPGVRRIAGYECKQAYYTTEDPKQTITAWYTEEIRPHLGPGRYNTLPGTILAIDINNEEQVMVATKVELRPLKKTEIKIPRGGEAITWEGFKSEMEAVRKRMGNHGVIIRGN
jgi:GLPGLI family protein